MKNFHTVTVQVVTEIGIIVESDNEKEAIERAKTVPFDSEKWDYCLLEREHIADILSTSKSLKFKVETDPFSENDYITMSDDLKKEAEKEWLLK